MFNIIRADRLWNEYKFSPEVIAWRDAVIGYGGSISRPSMREMLRKNRLFHNKMVSGAWDLIDDMVDLGAENEVQALTSLKRRFLCIATNDVPHVPGAGYDFDGYSHLIEWPFIPSQHAVAMTATNQRLAALAITNQSSNDFALGSSHEVLANRRLTLRPGSSTVMGANFNSPTVVSFSLGAAPADHSGWSVASRSSSSTMRAYKNDQRLADATGLTLADGLPDYPFFIGANNVLDVAGRTLQWIGMVVEIGAQLSDRQEAATYAGIRELVASRDIEV